MAFFLTPRFAPAYAPQCGPWSSAPARPSCPSYRRPSRASRPAVAPFAPFLSQLDDLFGALDREARQQTEQRQQRKRVIRAHFNVHENDKGYQIDGEVPGFEQDHLDIEVLDEHTLRVAGNTEKTAHQTQPTQAETIEPEAHDEVLGGVSVNEDDQAPTRATSPDHSDTESHNSYHATVEDDFEDLGAEVASTLSANAKGKEKATEESASLEVVVQPQPETPASETLAQETEDRFYGSFDRTFRFPDRIDASSVRASLRNGLLSVTVPRAKAPEVKRILIQ